jgi:hypothetical protein
MVFTANCQKKWRFAVVGDTHVGSSDTIAEMLPFMVADSIECLLVAGDIAEGGLACSTTKLQGQIEHWQSLLKPLYDKQIGVYPIYGNHENDAKSSTLAWNNVFSGVNALPQNGPTGEVNFTYYFTHKNALFIALDDYKNIHKVNQAWLDQQLASNTRPHVFVFGHEAAFKVFHSDCLDDSIDARNSFWQSLSKAGVKVYFCGHDHFVDVANVEDGDGNATNDLIQYLVGTGGGWLMSQYSNYNGTNSPYTPKRLFHDMEFGYALVEVSGDGINDLNVTITWKKRNWNASKSKYEYINTSNIVQYTANAATSIHTLDQIELSIFPNPASNSITLSGFWGDTSIYNEQGLLMWYDKINDLQSIETSAYPSGVYFVRNGTSIKKFILKK